MSKLTLGKLSSSERSLTDKLTELDLDKGWLPPTLSLKKPLIPPKSQSRVSRELLLLTSDAKSKYLNDNDRLMFKVYYEKSGDKENQNTKNSTGNTGSSTELILSEESLLSYLGNLVHFLGRNKLELERELALQKNDQLSQYEIHLQRLEAQIREHIRIEQQLKLYAESLQAKVDDFHRQEANQEENRSSSEPNRAETEEEHNLPSGGYGIHQEHSNAAPVKQGLARNHQSKDKFCMTAEFPNGLAGRVATVGTATTQSQTAGCNTVSNLGCGGHFLPRNSSSPIITTVGSGCATGKDHFSNSELQEAMEAMCEKIRALEDENIKRREEIQLRDAKIEALEDENKSLKVRMDKMKGLLGNPVVKSLKGSNLPSWAPPTENSNSKFGDTMPAANQPEPVVLNYTASAANKRNKGRGNRMSNIEELIHGKKDSIFGTTNDLISGPNNRSVSNEKIKENSLHERHILKQMLHKVGNGSFSDLNREKMLSAKLVKTNRPGTSIKDPRLLFDRKVSNKKSCKKKQDTCRIEVKVNPFMTSDARNGLLMRSGDFSKPRGIGYRSHSIDAAGKKLPKEKRKRTPDYSMSFMNTASGKTMLKVIGEQFSHLKSLRANQSQSGGDKVKGFRLPANKS